MGTSERTPRADRTPHGKPAAASRVTAKDSDARERILTTAYGLFCRHGIGAVGVDTIIDQSDVAKMTLYRHFRSKDDLVLAVLQRREELWTEGWLAAEVRRRTSDPAGRLLAVFDVFDGWFRRRSFEGCLFVNALLEVEDRKHPIHQASREQLAHIRSFLEELARDAGVPEPERFARQWHILMKGSIVAATEGDVDAALRAQAMGRLLLASTLGQPVLAATPA
jgi:AcrR family transcriptional regulator